MRKRKKKLDRFDEILKLQQFYFDEAKRCKKARAYFAGSIMLGAVLEVSLLAMMELYPEEVKSSLKTPIRKGKPKPLPKWTLVELLDVAKNLKWLPASFSREDEFDSKKAKVGDYAEIVREIRNLVHPGKFISDYLGTSITKEHYDLSFDITLAAYKWLQHKVINSLKDQSG